MTDNPIAGSVEISSLPDGGVYVREGADAHDGPVLTFTREEWVAFVAGVKNGEFDPDVPDTVDGV